MHGYPSSQCTSAICLISISLEQKQYPSASQARNPKRQANLRTRRMLHRKTLKIASVDHDRPWKYFFRTPQRFTESYNYRILRNGSRIRNHDPSAEQDDYMPKSTFVAYRPRMVDLSCKHRKHRLPRRFRGSCDPTEEIVGWDLSHHKSFNRTTRPHM